MTCRRRYRILMPEGKLSGDTFVLPPEQPRNLKPGCTMLIHERSGTFLTVHDTRLLPAEAAGAIPVADTPKSACSKYDRVQGLIKVRLSCPDGDGFLRGMAEPNETAPGLTMPLLAPLMDYRKNLVGQ